MARNKSYTVKFYTDQVINLTVHEDEISVHKMDDENQIPIIINGVASEISIDAFLVIDGSLVAVGDERSMIMSAMQTFQSRLDHTLLKLKDESDQANEDEIPNEIKAANEDEIPDEIKAANIDQSQNESEEQPDEVVA